MKTIKLIATAFILSTLAISCSTSTVKEEIAAEKELAGASIPVLGPNTMGRGSNYIITLESRTQNADGTWAWVWSVQNPNPGNGNNGTIQDLSHWGMTLGSCVVFADIVSAGTSSNGTSWNAFAPKYEIDPSQNCFVTPVLKFDAGTYGSAKTFYRLVVRGEYGIDNTAVGFSKSGKKSACTSQWFQGIGCADMFMDN